MRPRRAEGSALGAPRARAEASLEQPITCGFCGHRFEAAEGRQSCEACSLLGSGCRSLRCPRCGYENPEEPRWIARLRGWLSRQSKGHTP